MSDDTSQYFQAWSSVMVDPGDVALAKLSCAWHVKRGAHRQNSYVLERVDSS